jgi:hypothetical protein
LIKYIAENQLSNSEAQNALLLWVMEKKRKRMDRFKLQTVAGPLSSLNLLGYIIESNYEEVIKVKPIYVTFGKDKSTTIIEATQQSRKERKTFENLKNKRSKQKMQ